MKRKITAIVLCAALCLSAMGETVLAMDFGSGESVQEVQETDPVSQEQTDENDVVSQEADTASTQDFSGGDLFTDGDVSEYAQAAQTENNTENPVITGAADPAGDAVSADASLDAAEETDEVQPALLGADGSVTAVPASWVSSGTKWRLRKTLLTSQAPETEAEQDASEEELETAEAEEASEAEEVSETVPAETAFSDNETPAEAEEALLVSQETAQETPEAEETVSAETEAEETLSEEAAETIAEETQAEETSDAAAEETTEEAADPEASEDALLTDSSDYYTLSDGLVYVKTQVSATDTTILSEGYYLFDAEGYMISGQYTIAGTVLNTPTPGQDKVYYFMDSTHASLKAGYTGSMTPYNSDLGQMQKKYWLWDGSAFKYFGSDGYYCTVDELNTLNSKKATHYGSSVFSIAGHIYYLNAEGTPQVFSQYKAVTNVYKGTAKKVYYYFQTTAESGLSIPGAALTNAWKSFNINGKVKWLYFQKNATAKTHGIMIAKLTNNNRYYLLSASGYVLRNARKKAVNGAYYISDKYGRIYQNKLITYGKYRYYLNSYGKQANWTNCWKRLSTAGNHTYYFGSVAGRVQEKFGWQKITYANGSYAWLLFNPNTGNNYLSCMQDGCFFDENGKAKGGIQKYEGKYYAFEYPTASEHKGHYYANQWIKGADSKLYYANADGTLCCDGWVNIGGSYYCFNADCSVKVDQFIMFNGVGGYVDSYGKYCSGWVVVSDANNLVKYINPDGSGWAVDTSLVIDGYTYFFDSNGYRMTDVSSKVSGNYLEADRVNGVMTVYNNSSKTIPVKTIRISVGASGTETPTGTYSLSQGGRWQLLMGPSYGQFATHVDGAGQGGIYIHSVAGSAANSYSLPWYEYIKLGDPASHGCIRVCVADAYWVYTNCIGGTVRIFDGTYQSEEWRKGPLGRNPLTPLYGTMDFDPTDPFL